MVRVYPDGTCWSEVNHELESTDSIEAYAPLWCWTPDNRSVLIRARFSVGEADPREPNWTITSINRLLYDDETHPYAASESEDEEIPLETYHMVSLEGDHFGDHPGAMLGTYRMLVDLPYVAAQLAQAGLYQNVPDNDWLIVDLVENPDLSLLEALPEGTLFSWRPSWASPELAAHD